jgi:outer membrane protein W
LAAAFVLSLLSAHGSAFAQTYWAHLNKKWEVSFFAGGSSIGDKNASTPIEGGEGTRIVGLGYASGYLLGLRITENLGQHAGAELQYSFANQPLAFTNLSSTIPRLDLDHSVHSFIYTLAVYLKNRDSRFRPFLAAGGGAAFYVIDGRAKSDAEGLGVRLKNQWKLAFSVGGGLKYVVKDNFGVRFDVKNQITGVPSYGLPSTHSSSQGEVGPAFRPSGQLYNWQFNAGIYYQWD